MLAKKVQTMSNVFETPSWNSSSWMGYPKALVMDVLSILLKILTWMWLMVMDEFKWLDYLHNFNFELQHPPHAPWPIYYLDLIRMTQPWKNHRLQWQSVSKKGWLMLDGFETPNWSASS